MAAGSGHAEMLLPPHTRPVPGAIRRTCQGGEGQEQSSMVDEEIPKLKLGCIAPNLRYFGTFSTKHGKAHATELESFTSLVNYLRVLSTKTWPKQTLKQYIPRGPVDNPGLSPQLWLSRTSKIGIVFGTQKQ